MTNFELTALIAGPEPQDDSPDSFCAEVDDASAATANMSPYNTWSIYGNPTYYDQGECMLATDNVSKIVVALYPNPVQEDFQIESLEKVESVSIFSLAGKEVAHFGSQNTYDISQLPTGVYFVKIKSTTGESIKRVIKK